MSNKPIEDIETSPLESVTGGTGTAGPGQNPQTPDNHNTGITGGVSGINNKCPPGNWDHVIVDGRELC